MSQCRKEFPHQDNTSLQKESALVEMPDFLRLLVQQLNSSYSRILQTWTRHRWTICKQLRKPLMQWALENNRNRIALMKTKSYKIAT